MVLRPAFSDDQVFNLSYAVRTWYFLYMSHQLIDAVSLELGRRVASELRRRPECLDVARSNLERWARQNDGVPSLLRCYEEWQSLLSRPIDEVCAVLTSETEEGQRLRQNSPFAGVLPPREVWEIKDRLRHATSST